MKFEKPLVTGKLIKRYKRFLADVQLDNGEVITAHCANSGGLYGVCMPGVTVWLSESANLERKLKYTWELVRVGQQIIGVNTSWPNHLVEEAIRDGTITELQGFTSLKREVKYGNNSRLDFLLEYPTSPDCYVEIKNVHMKRETTAAEFPDAVTARGVKHLNEMIEVIKEGKRAVMLYVVQRQDCDSLQFAEDIDFLYAETARKAKLQGVEFYAYFCDLTPLEIKICQSIPVLV